MNLILPQIAQESESHCGPAVLEMLLKHQGIFCTQDQIVAAAGVTETILENGTRPYQLAQAVKSLTPHLQLWFKQNATVADLYHLIHDYNQPVAIDWQALFYDSVEEEKEQCPEENIYGDHGHYSIVVDIDPIRNQIVLIDPYPDYYQNPRQFSLSWFVSRWWDYAADISPITGKSEVIRPTRFLFILAPHNSTIARAMDLEPSENLHKLLNNS